MKRYLLLDIVGLNFFAFTTRVLKGLLFAKKLYFYVNTKIFLNLYVGIIRLVNVVVWRLRRFFSEVSIILFFFLKFVILVRKDRASRKDNNIFSIHLKKRDCKKLRKINKIIVFTVKYNIII